MVRAIHVPQITIRSKKQIRIAMFSSMTMTLPSKSATSSDPTSQQNTLESAGEGKSTRRQSNTDQSTDSSSVSSLGGSRSFSQGFSSKRAPPSYAVEFNATNEVPEFAITYEIVTIVIDSWEQGIKQIRNWKCSIGDELARKILEMDPGVSAVLGLPTNTRYRDQRLSENKEFIAKTGRLIDGIDSAVSSLGPDLSLLRKQSFEMGEQLSVFNCRPHHWQLVGKALLYVLHARLGESFTKEHRESWTTLYNFSSNHMVAGLLQRKPNLAGIVPCPHEIEVQAKSIVQRRCSSNNNESTRTKKQSVTLDCLKQVSADEITFGMVTSVLSSWEKGIKEGVPNWSSINGFLFMRYIFKHTGAEGREVMGYPEDVKWDDPALAKDSTFRMKGIRLIKAIDMALSFLGPDLSPLEVTMFDLGRRHYHMNCKPEHWPLVGEALFDVFRDCMGEGGSSFTPEVEEAWTVIYNFLGYHMIRGLNAEKADNR